MEIESISHKALKRFFLSGNSKGLVGDIERLRAMLAFIVAAASLDELENPPNNGFHRLTGNRAGTWSMTVTRNWRLTFTVEGSEYRHRVAVVYDSAERGAAAIGYGRSLHSMWDKRPAAKLPPVPLSKWGQERAG